MNLGALGRLLLLVALLLAVAGLVLLLADRLGGRLPGDIVWRRGNVTVYVPLGLMLLLSILLTLLLNLIFRR